MRYLLNRAKVQRAWPPKGGWIYTETATGWKAPSPKSDNFDRTVDKIIAHRFANRAYKLSVDRTEVEHDLMHQTALRILTDAPEHAADWIVAGDDDGKKKLLMQPEQGARGEAVVARARSGNMLERILARVRGISRGASTLADWLGDGASPVSVMVADKRSKTCASCPLNRPEKDWVDTLTESIAEAIRKQTIVKNALGLCTSHEDKLGFCDACGCPLRLKVFMPIETIRARMDSQSVDDLHPSCWIKRERMTAVASGNSRPTPTKTITIQRRAAYGDVILASIIATKLQPEGVATRFITEGTIVQALQGHPHIDEWLTNGHPTVQLDKTYEGNIERDRKDIALLFMEAAAPQLERQGIRLPDMVNRVPVLGIEDSERLDALRLLGGLPRPRIVVVDGSGSWPNRYWDRGCVESLPRVLKGFGSLIWSKPNGWVRRPTGFADIDIKNFRQLMAIISEADLVLTPDTGPMHIAAAFNKPIVALEQCNDTRLRLTNLTDWISVAPDLDCVRCNQFICPKNEKNPPCRVISPEVVAGAIRLKWGSYSSERVSAIIPVLHRSDRLEKCVKSVISQVDEVVVVLDGAGTVSDSVRGMGVRVVESTGERLGYGKSNMRGIRQSTGRFLLLLNDDCYLDPGAVERMKRTALPTVGVVGCLLRYPDGTIQHGGKFRPPGAIGFGHIDHRKRTPSITEPCDMEDVTFAAALIRREALYDVRGFDERFDCYSEDSDLCMKMGAAGWRVMYDPTATGIHDESQTTSPTKEAMLRESARIFDRKWRPVLSSTTPLFSHG